MLIGIDMDDTLIEFIPGLLVYHNDAYGTSFDKEDVHDFRLWKIWGGTREEAIRKVYEFYETEYFRELKPIEYAVQAVDVLAEDNDLVIITSRPEEKKNVTRMQAYKHFSKKFDAIYYTGEFHGNNVGKKSDICAMLGIDVMIEDYMEYAKACASKNTKVFLLEQPWNRKRELSDGIERVKGWKELLTKI